MRRKTGRGPRESALARGWVVESDPPNTQPAPPGPTPSDGRTATVGAPDNRAPRGEDIEDVDAAQGVGQVSNAALVLFGVFGGLYILYTWVWMTWAQYYSIVNSATAAGSGSLGGVLQQMIFWAAPVAPALWFLSAVMLSRHRTGRLAVSLLIGAVVLLPVPMFVSSGAAL